MELTIGCPSDGPVSADDLGTLGHKFLGCLVNWRKDCRQFRAIDKLCVGFGRPLKTEANRDKKRPFNKMLEGRFYFSNRLSLQQRQSHSCSEKAYKRLAERM